MNSKMLDGIDKKGMKGTAPSFGGVLNALAELLGNEVIEAHAEAMFGPQIAYYPGYYEIGKGDSQGWLSKQEELLLIQQILANVGFDTGRQYKQWIGRYEHIVVQYPFLSSHNEWAMTTLIRTLTQYVPAIQWADTFNGVNSKADVLDFLNTAKTYLNKVLETRGKEAGTLLPATLTDLEDMLVRAASSN